MHLLENLSFILQATFALLSEIVIQGWEAFLIYLALIVLSVEPTPVYILELAAGGVGQVAHHFILPEFNVRVGQLVEHFIGVD